MSERKDGGPAFPRPSYGPNEPADGMTLRDHFAGQAMAAIIATPGWLLEDGAAANENSEVATAAYQMADAMIAARGA